VRTAAELKNIVAQTVAYGGKGYGKTAVFAADNYDQAQRYDFKKDSEKFIAQLPGSWQVQRAYLDNLTLGNARSVLTSAINSGVALTSFVGHSGPSDWTFDGLFKSADVASLTNAGKPTVVTQWGCWNTYFVYPAANTLGHAFLLNGDRGAAAVLGASTLTEAPAEAALAGKLFAHLASPGVSLGEAILQAKRELAAEHPEMTDVILGWQLLGDPLLKIVP
jgi:hypothetical protein